MSISGLSDEDIQAVLDWVDEIPLSRPKKNISRDFSDGLMMAEIMKHYFPKTIELHNYPATNTIMQKKNNWSTLNTKAFKKINFRLDKNIIEELSNSKSGVIEKVLFNIKEKINLYLQKKKKKTQRINEINNNDNNINLNPDDFTTDNLENQYYNFNENNNTNNMNNMNMNMNNMNMNMNNMNNMNMNNMNNMNMNNMNMNNMNNMNMNNMNMNNMNTNNMNNMNNMNMNNMNMDNHKNDIQKLNYSLPNINNNNNNQFSPYNGNTNITNPSDNFCMPQINKLNSNNGFEDINILKQEIEDLKETIDILELKIQKQDQLLKLKDEAIQNLSGQLHQMQILKKHTINSNPLFSQNNEFSQTPTTNTQQSITNMSNDYTRPMQIQPNPQVNLNSSPGGGLYQSSFNTFEGNSNNLLPSGLSTNPFNRGHNSFTYN